MLAVAQMPITASTAAFRVSRCQESSEIGKKREDRQGQNIQNDSVLLFGLV
jgi:hypothetical protein